ncbi:glycosyltransferase [candidate division WWE3 bacterium]|uniref:Glycosyltransferase n=1 Tax=candidate division WWE3 bacterium TaxID=2053526 RepID=A0A955LV49_UNCKA|nr:glycosyltransferase [candidate division WWE3 bacterium]
MMVYIFFISIVITFILLIPLIINSRRVSPSFNSVYGKPKDTTISDELPMISIIKPVKGIDENLRLNFLSFIYQGYEGVFEIIFTLENNKEDAFPLVEQLAQEFPSIVKVALSGEWNGIGNPKVHNLIAGEKEALGDIILISDADVVVHRNYLTEIATYFQTDSTVAAVTSLYRFRSGKTFWAIIYGLIFTANNVIGYWLTIFSKAHFLFGASIAIRREVLNDVGGFAAVKDYLMEDLYLARLLKKKNYHIILTKYPILVVKEYWSFAEYVANSLRWFVCIRKTSFRYYILLGLLPIPSFIAVITLIYGINYSSQLLIWSALAILLIKVLVATVSVFIEKETGYRKILLFWLIPFAEMSMSIIWFYSLLTSSVHWRGRHYQVGQNGRISHDKS